MKMLVANLDRKFEEIAGEIAAIAVRNSPGSPCG
jgi:hypothetical protein